jgi:hypothetical protein
MVLGLHAITLEPRRGGREGWLTDEAVGAAAIDDIEGGNRRTVGEGAPSSAPVLHERGTYIRLCLSGGEKRRSGMSPATAEVTHVIRGGGWSSCPMGTEPRAKGAQGSKDHLCKRNHPWAGPIDG